MDATEVDLENQPPVAHSKSKVGESVPRLSATRAGRPPVAEVVVILLCSIIVIISALDEAQRGCNISKRECDLEQIYAIVVGGVGAGVCLAYLLFVRLCVAKPWTTQLLSIFFAFWWAAGAGITTFRSPFLKTENGYFAVWLGYMVSLHTCYVHVPFVKRWLDRAKNATTQDSNGKALLFLVIGSIIVLIACWLRCGRDCKGNDAWGLALGAASTVISVLFMVVTKLPLRWIAAFILAGMWLLGVGVLTFDSPFKETSNGFFACWIGFFASVLWFVLELTKAFPGLKGRSEE
eukprot:c52318_g1_i1.p1 GENE.c52318_g1_i1~~c52318_g1_i1.p1  ORF type:complete len:292 (-),score=54.81 c52318_g1_i1:19-894(-)